MRRRRSASPGDDGLRAGRAEREGRRDGERESGSCGRRGGGGRSPCPGAAGPGAQIAELRVLVLPGIAAGTVQTGAVLGAAGLGWGLRRFGLLISLSGTVLSRSLRFCNSRGILVQSEELCVGGDLGAC